MPQLLVVLELIVVLEVLGGPNPQFLRLPENILEFLNLGFALSPHLLQLLPEPVLYLVHLPLQAAPLPLLELHPPPPLPLALVHLQFFYLK